MEYLQFFKQTFVEPLSTYKIWLGLLLEGLNIAEYIKEQTGCFVHYEEIGKDADQRDYEVSYSKLESEGFSCNVSMKEGINDLIKVTPLLQIRHQYS